MHMFQVSRQDSVDRENIIRDGIAAALVHVTAQVENPTTTVQVLRDQLGSNADFSTDAMQQIRAEFEDAKQSISHPATNAGAIWPDHLLTPLVNNTGKPIVKTSGDIDSYAVTCSY